VDVEEEEEEEEELDATIVDIVEVEDDSFARGRGIGKKKVYYFCMIISSINNFMLVLLFLQIGGKESQTPAPQ
jgi:hypothetical protein